MTSSGAGCEKSSSRSVSRRNWSVVSGAPSGLTVAVQSPLRDRTFLTYLGVNADWRPSMIPEDALHCENLLLCDYFVAPGLQAEAAQGLLAATRAAGGRTFFDTSWDPDGFSADDPCGRLPSAAVGRRVPSKRSRGVRARGPRS